MRTQRGFSLIELLIVIAIILIIAAIAIPNLLQARMASNEASGVASISAVKSAQALYYNTYSTIGYAAQLSDLGGAAPCAPSSTTACLIDDFLAQSAPGTHGKGGYVYRSTGIATGGSTINTDYATGAAPIMVHQTGNRDFCSTSDGVLRSMMGSVGDVPVASVAACQAFPVSQ